MENQVDINIAIINSNAKHPSGMSAE